MMKSNFNEIINSNFFLETSLLFHWKYENYLKSEVIITNRLVFYKNNPNLVALKQKVLKNCG